MEEKNYIPHPKTILNDCCTVLRFFEEPIPFPVVLHLYNKVTHRDLSTESYQYGYRCPEEFLETSELFVFVYKENITYVGLKGYTTVSMQEWQHLCQSFGSLALIEEKTDETKTEEEPPEEEKRKNDSSNERPKSLYRSHYSVTVADHRRP